MVASRKIRKGKVEEEKRDHQRITPALTAPIALVLDYSRYSMRPLLFEAAQAHREGIISYNPDGSVLFRNPYQTTQTDVPRLEAITIPPQQQFPAIFATFQDLNKALSQLSNSPRLSSSQSEGNGEEKKSLRARFDEEFAHYLKLMEETYTSGGFEPDYGTYLFDPLTTSLYLLAPSYWHRLGLVTNTSHLLTDPHHKLSWQQVRAVFDRVVIGFVGASVGGNLVEGVLREFRPQHLKIADPDWVEITNLNRFEHGSIRHLVGSRAERFDPRNPYEVIRVNKAELTAHTQQLTDPYASWYVYSEGIHRDNLERFLLGDGKEEPSLDILIEEADDLRLKVELRALCRQHHIPVLMLSDFGHATQGQFQDFRADPHLPLGYQVSDEQLWASLEECMSSGKREDRFAFIRALCGNEFERDEFGAWVRGEGEQPTSSLPQSGATAMAAGAIGGKVLARYLLGHPIPSRFIYDFANNEVLVD